MKILIIASGGDAPGINSFLWFLSKDIIKSAKIYFARYGLKGIAQNDIEHLHLKDNDTLYNDPSSFIKCGRLPEFELDLSIRNNVINKIKKYDYFIIMGGNGSYEAAKIINKSGVKTIFVPLTIDNDIYGIDESLGFNTSLDNSIENINRIQYTIKAHGYVGLVQIMGRGCSNLTRNAARLSLADIAVTSEKLKTPKEFALIVHNIFLKQGYCIGLITEDMKYNILDYKKEIDLLGMKCRNTILGHTQRGGISSLRDMQIASSFSKCIWKNIKDNNCGKIVYKNSNSILQAFDQI